MDNPYVAFDNFILRNPLLSLRDYHQLTKEKKIDLKSFQDLFQNPLIQESIYLASPQLFEELNKWLIKNKSDDKESVKLANSFLKYLSRMSSRCTPFGLFAGCGVGSIDSSSATNLSRSEARTRHTRLDMNYLVALSQNISKNEIFRKQLLFFPNNSAYQIGDQLRYIEYKYFNGKRVHHIASVDNSVYLTKIMKACEKGLLLEQLANIIVDNTVSFIEAQGFIDQLVDNQLLVSEIEPSISGPEVLSQIIKILDGINGSENILAILNQVEVSLKNIDISTSGSIGKYKEIGEHLKEIGTTFDQKYLFQTDMFFDCDNSVLSKEIVDSVLQGMALFNKITLPNQNKLHDFKNAFFERFGEREIQMSKALDVEMGVGYIQNDKNRGINSLVDDIVFSNNVDSPVMHNLSTIDLILHKKILNAISNNTYAVLLTKDDFKDFKENWEDLPDTFSALIEVLTVNGISKIKFSGLGGSSGANLIGRFSNEFESIKNYTQKIVDVESEINRGKIIAEIIHLPEARVGNILMRPKLRKYEIPYLSKSLLKSTNQIPVSDLYISIKNNKIFLRSKRLNKEVIPRLTNAHNYANNALPTYQFLCDMQSQNLRGHLGINLGSFVKDLEFVPRIEFYDLILSEAYWNVKSSDLAKIYLKIKTEDELIVEIKNFVDKKKLPQYVLLVEGDNELLINFKNLNSVRMLLKTVKKRPGFILKEFLFSEDDNFKSSSFYTNEILLSFYNKSNLKYGEVN